MCAGDDGVVSFQEVIEGASTVCECLRKEKKKMTRAMPRSTKLRLWVSAFRECSPGPYKRTDPRWKGTHEEKDDGANAGMSKQAWERLSKSC